MMCDCVYLCVRYTKAFSKYKCEDYFTLSTLQYTRVQPLTPKASFQCHASLEPWAPSGGLYLDLLPDTGAIPSTHLKISVSCFLGPLEEN